MVLALVAVFSLCGLGALEKFKVTKNQSYFKEKIQAAKFAKEAFKEIKEERLKRKIEIDPETDPAQTGLIGRLMSAITSNKGDLPAKQTSVNPNFAAVVLHLLREAGVRQGDVVAVGVSGSFPAINMSVYAALETLKAHPIIISSAASSQWGANISKFSWLDMENHLFKNKIFPFRSVAASLGGIEDRALGMTKKEKGILKETIKRNELPFLEAAGYQQSFEKRMALYREHANGAPIRAYVNVGGQTSSVGKKAGKRHFHSGLVTTSPDISQEIDSVMWEFSQNGVPVIHLVRFAKLAAKYGLPLQPDRLPSVGEGIVFVKKEPSKILALSVLGSILFLLFAFVRSDLGFRIVQTFQSGPKGERRSEKMM